MRLLSVAVIVVLLASALARHRTNSTGGEDDRGNADILVDAILILLNPNLPANVAIPVATLPFTSNCVMYGLDGGFRRVGDATARISLAKTILTFKVKAKQQMGLLCDYKFAFFQGTVTLKMNNIRANIIIIQPTLGVLTLDKFDLSSPTFGLSITGMGPLGLSTSAFFLVIAPILTPLVVNVLETAIQTLITDLFAVGISEVQ